MTTEFKNPREENGVSFSTMICSYMQWMPWRFENKTRLGKLQENILGDLKFGSGVKEPPYPLTPPSSEKPLAIYTSYLVHLHCCLPTA